MRKHFIGKLNVYRRYQADTKLAATVIVDGQKFEYYPAPKCFLNLVEADKRLDIGLSFNADEDGKNPRGALPRC